MPDYLSDDDENRQQKQSPKPSQQQQQLQQQLERSQTAQQQVKNKLPLPPWHDETKKKRIRITPPSIWDRKPNKKRSRSRKRRWD